MKGLGCGAFVPLWLLSIVACSLPALRGPGSLFAGGRTTDAAWPTAASSAATTCAKHRRAARSAGRRDRLLYRSDSSS